jgi:hypothetical protein
VKRCYGGGAGTVCYGGVGSYSCPFPHLGFGLSPSILTAGTVFELEPVNLRKSGRRYYLLATLSQPRAESLTQTTVTVLLESPSNGFWLTHERQTGPSPTPQKFNFRPPERFLLHGRPIRNSLSAFTHLISVGNN